MANGKELFKTNANALQKVFITLNMSQTMAFSQVILSETNQKKLQEASDKISEAIKILRDIK